MPLTLISLALILAYVWLVEPRAPRTAVVVPIVGVLALGFWNARRRGEWGFAPRAFLPSLGAAAAFTAAAAAGVLAAGSMMGTLQDRSMTPVEVAGLVVWGGAQQWLLQTLVLRESQAVSSRRAGVPLAAALFAAVHLPNVFLAAFTFAGALAWCSIYDRYPNVVPLALSHATGTLAILLAFDDTITGRLRIGAAYLELMR